MSHDFSKVDNWDEFLTQTAKNQKRNLIEVIELLAQDKHLSNVDFNKSIALVDQDELYVHISHGLDQLFEQTYAKDERKTNELLDRAGRLIADRMYESVKRLRIIEKQ